MWISHNDMSYTVLTNKKKNEQTQTHRVKYRKMQNKKERKEEKALLEMHPNNIFWYVAFVKI